MQGRGWDDKKKTEAVVTFLALGKLPLVESVTGVPRATLKTWKLQPWWKELEEEIRREDEYQLDAKLSRIIDRSLDAVAERIDGGEFILDSKTGTIKRIPVKLKDVHRVAVDLVDKRNLIRGKPTSRVEKTETKDTLQRLAEQFASWVQLNMRKRDAIEGEVVHAVHEEREEGLQDGIQQIPLEQEGKDETRSAQ